MNILKDFVFIVFMILLSVLIYNLIVLVSAISSDYLYLVSEGVNPLVVLSS